MPQILVFGTPWELLVLGVTQLLPCEYFKSVGLVSTRAFVDQMVVGFISAVDLVQDMVETLDVFQGNLK